VRALRASIEHDLGAAWTPTMSTASLSELMGEFERRDDAFSEMRMTLHGITVAEFRGDRICSLRQYWDELSVFDQLGLLRDGALR
jgi:ketosteroid isomerase-like protein